MVIDVKSRQILGFHIRDRSKGSGEILMKKLPEELKKSHFYTHHFSVYFKVIPKKQYRPVGKDQGKQITLKDLTA